MHDLETLRLLFSSKFDTTPTIEIRANGRINIIGEHTDYNMGFVLPAAIDKYIYFVGAKNGLDHFRVYAADLEEYDTISLADPLVKSDKLWTNYLTGILDQYRLLGVQLEGLDCVFGGNLPVGSGMSSSAALETGFATLIKEVFQVAISKPEMAQLAQSSSHQFIGVPCGIMDQFASLMGKEKQLLLLDCQSLDFQYIPCDLGQYQIVLINSKVSHNLNDSAYETRVKECQEGVNILSKYQKGLTSLREASPELVRAHEAELGDTVFRRCLYVTSENERLQKVCDHLQKGEIEAVGSLLFETHEGLRDLYEVSCEEVDFLVDFAKNYPGAIGSRIMGGGFGGCSINLVDESRLSSFIEAVDLAYFEQFKVQSEAYEVKIVDGTNVIKTAILS